MIINITVFNICRSRSKVDHMEPSYHDYVGKCNDMGLYNPTHLLAIIYGLTWLSPCHALGEYKLTCLQFQFSPPLACGLWALPNPSGSCWLNFVWGSLVYSSSSWCSFVGCVVSILRVLCRAAPSWWLYRDSRLGSYSVVVAGCYYLYLLWGKKDWVPVSPFLPVKKGFQYPGSWPLVARPFAGK